MTKHVSWMWLVGFALGIGTAHADVIYDVTLTSTQGKGQHTGTVTLNQALPSTGTVVYQFPNPQQDLGHTPGYDITGFNVSGFTHSGIDGFSLPTPYMYGLTITASVKSTDGTPDFNFDIDLSDNNGNTAEYYEFELNTGTYVYSDLTLHSGTSRHEYQYDAGTVAIVPEGNAVTPEPGSVALLGTGLVGLAVLSRRRFAIG